jgi:oxaloacetate decarboxylase gamma subunit
MNIEMLEQSGVLTLLGMGVVFGFLIILVIAVILTGKVIHALGGDKDVPDSGTAGPGVRNDPAGGTKPAVAAAITVAVNEYRKTNF